MNGLAVGAMLALASLAFSAIFAVRRYLNFSIGALATMGAYAGWYASSWGDLPLILLVLASFLFAGAVGLLSEQTAIAPLQKGGALAMAIGSLALAIILENLIRLAFGNTSFVYPVPLERDLVVGPVHFGAQQLKNLFIVIVTMLVLWFTLAHTRFGRMVRAVAENEQLAKLRGVLPFKVKSVALFVAFGICGVTGLLFGLDSAIDPMLGTRLLLSIFAAAVLGGLGSVPGAVLGALIIGIIEELTATYMSPSYRLVVGFMVIFIGLTFFPRGLVPTRNG